MAWNDMAKVGQLLASLGQLSNTNGAWQTAGSGKGKWAKAFSKGKSKDNAKDTGGTECFLCLWDDCAAAQKQVETWSGKSACYCCGRAKGTAKAPPVERLVETAYLAQLKAVRVKDLAQSGAQGGGGKGAGKAKGKG